MTTDRAFAPHERTLPAMLVRQAREFGGRPFLSIAGATWLHHEMAGVAARRAGALRAAGIRRGDRVAVMCGNRAEFIETLLGCGWLGAVLVPINSASMRPQIEYVLADCSARLLVIEGRFAERLGERVPESVWTVPHGWPATGDALPAEAVEHGDPLAILYTSGTTGPAKGVVCPHAQYHWWGVNTASVLQLGAADVLCTTLPLFHINALNTFAQAAIVGCRVEFASAFHASTFWPEMRSRDTTVIYLLGAMVPMLLAQPAGAHECEHSVRIGLGPGVPAAAGAAFRERCGVTLLEGYGSTETNFVIATAPDSPRVGVMGWLRPGFDARVVDEHDVDLPAGEAGELVLRADEPFAFASGYFGKPDQTVEAWRNLWFHTGDRVVRDADGAFRFVDRIKDAIRRRGENISSWEVEQALMSHAAVAAVAVYPVRSELAEDEVMASVVLREGAAVAPADLAHHCAALLPKFALPRYIDLVADLPRTENGKVQKYRLRERGVTPTCWDRDRA
ncbi:MAG TPA: ATP-dependent acyl-CoA ligase [Burkholderiaceae bacterium]|nr:ATP-dependent acyl-CoA ligase [Burkholderiaceae bacterium]